jgi:sigma-E factor negative regulatory protein RseB
LNLLNRWFGPAGAHLIFLSAGLLLGFVPVASAQSRAPAESNILAPGPVLDPDMGVWLKRVHEASRRRAYIGTFVVSAGGHMASARIWHVCDGEQQVERVESLTGVPRSTFRRNDQVMTFLPQSKVVISEKRESLGLFPNLLSGADSAIAQSYRVKLSGQERVAGFEADVVQLQAQDRLRFGYRVWTEKKTGLVVKVQTLDTAGRVLEQAAFSELQLDVPVSMSKLTQMMNKTQGYEVETPALTKTTAAAEGWAVKSVVSGFKPVSCNNRVVSAEAGTPPAPIMQCVFSDGLASVSLFIEEFDARRHAQPGAQAMGATHTLTRRMGDWWLTAVGEVPAPTLVIFAQGLERTR